MSCESEFPGGKYRAGEEPFNKKTVKKNRWRQFVISFCIVVWAVYTCAVLSLLWTKDSSMAESGKSFWESIFAGNDKADWEHLSGNDGKFWRGTPDSSSYSTMEGVECREYYHYSYDRQGRLCRTDYYRHHDYYEDIWCLDDEIDYEYDRQGRITKQSGWLNEWIYEYTENGYSKTYRYYSSGKEDTYIYDGKGNLTASRITTRYAAGYEVETTFLYDERNRLLQQTSRPGDNPAYLSLTKEYDDETHTALMKTYSEKGELKCIGRSAYDEEWRETANLWCDVEKLPEAVPTEDWADYSTVGYWADYQDGKLMEELTNERGGSDWNSGWYEAYDYDENGNCILNISIFSEGDMYMVRYEYDDLGRKTDEYHYNCSGVKNWEPLSDGSLLVIQNDTEDEEPLSITRLAQDGALVNQFVYGEDSVMQYTPAGDVCWHTSPRLFAQTESPESAGEEAFAGEKEAAGEDAPAGKKEPAGEDAPAGAASGEVSGEFYTVQPGDCLWSIGELFWGDGRMWRRIYLENRDTVGDDPGLILPGTELYLDRKWKVEE